MHETWVGCSAGARQVGVQCSEPCRCLLSLLRLLCLPRFCSLCDLPHCLSAFTDGRRAAGAWRHRFPALLRKLDKLQGGQGAPQGAGEGMTAWQAGGKAGKRRIDVAPGMHAVSSSGSWVAAWPWAGSQNADLTQNSSPQPIDEHQVAEHYHSLHLRSFWLLTSQKNPAPCLVILLHNAHPTPGHPFDLPAVSMDGPLSLLPGCLSARCTPLPCLLSLVPRPPPTFPAACMCPPFDARSACPHRHSPPDPHRRPGSLYRSSDRRHGSL